MPSMTGVSGNALSSLTSIDQWIKTLNSSVAGASRTGFKAEKITFGGGTTLLDKPANAGALGIQFAEQSLSVNHTSRDWTEGQVVASTEFQHLALSGSPNAFFMLTDKINAGTGLPNAAQNAKIYFTRDGEFHLDSSGYLRSQDGLYVIGNVGGTQRALQFSNGGPVNLANYDNDPEKAFAALIDTHNNTGTANEKFQHALILDLPALEFSKYGSTVYDGESVGIDSANYTSVLSDSSDLGTRSENVKVSGNALEASNVQLPSAMVELSLAQKIYSALTKVIQIDQQKLDGILNLIR